MKAYALPSAVILCLAGALSAAGCNSSIDVGTDADAGRESIFTPDDGGAGKASPESGAGGGLCPSSECPPGRVTCPNEPFPCSVDFSSDDENCGACGVRCPTDDTFLNQFHGVMHCVTGTCRLTCDEDHADCNGIPDDGCETLVAGPYAQDINNCGACGHVCTDICSSGSCGCPGGGTFCPSDGTCHDLDKEDTNCGACGNVCPPDTEPPFPPEWNMFRACHGGQCNVPQCLPYQRDCNNDFLLPNGDGCETATLFDANNCGECGRKCGPGETCFFGECTCPCGAECFKGLDTDPFNCGTCGLKCPGDQRSIQFSAALGLDPAHGRPICDQGVCGFTCSPHFADCDADISNGCETNLLSDPLNCGGCGVHCEGEGQPCIDGQCLTKGCGVQ